MDGGLATEDYAENGTAMGAVTRRRRGTMLLIVVCAYNIGAMYSLPLVHDVLVSVVHPVKCKL